jgi:hypothetical protein
MSNRKRNKKTKEKRSNYEMQQSCIHSGFKESSDSVYPNPETKLHHVTGFSYKGHAIPELNEKYKEACDNAKPINLMEKYIKELEEWKKLTGGGSPEEWRKYLENKARLNEEKRCKDLEEIKVMCAEIKYKYDR